MHSRSRTCFELLAQVPLVRQQELPRARAPLDLGITDPPDDAGSCPVQNGLVLGLPSLPCPKVTKLRAVHPVQVCPRLWKPCRRSLQTLRGVLDREYTRLRFFSVAFFPLTKQRTRSNDAQGGQNVTCGRVYMSATLLAGHRPIQGDAGRVAHMTKGH